MSLIQYVIIYDTYGVYSFMHMPTKARDVVLDELIKWYASDINRCTRNDATEPYSTRLQYHDISLWTIKSRLKNTVHLAGKNNNNNLTKKVSYWLVT